MLIVRNVIDLRKQVNQWRSQGMRVALVPTMGSLHQGHLSLIDRAKEKADKVVVSLFVNPKQFGPNEDFDAYPRSEDSDSQHLREIQTDMLYAPPASEIYASGHSTSMQVGAIGDLLEGEFRPGFFSGVATVVSKLLLQSQPHLAIFGEKDYQQLQVIKKFVREMDIPVDILGGETIREEDGLALSSRNAFLSPDERLVAPKLFEALQAVSNAAASNLDIDGQIQKSVHQLKDAGFSEIEYLTVRDSKTLLPVQTFDLPCRVLVAAKLGKTRLIDNMAV